MKARSLYFTSCVVATMFLFFNGCSDSGGNLTANLPDSVKLTGTVTLDGEPLEGVSIRFAPTKTEGMRGAAGVSGTSGQYELSTDLGAGKSRPGIIPGAYVVFVSRLVKPDGSLVPSNTDIPPMMSGARESIPMKYSSSQDQLKYVVTPEGGTFDLKLDSKPGKSGPGGFGPGIPSPGGPKIGS